MSSLLWISTLALETLAFNSDNEVEAEETEAPLDSSREACEKSKPSFAMIFFSFLFFGLMNCQRENIKFFTRFIFGFLLEISTVSDKGSNYLFLSQRRHFWNFPRRFLLPRRFLKLCDAGDISNSSSGRQGGQSSHIRWHLPFLSRHHHGGWGGWWGRRGGWRGRTATDHVCIGRHFIQGVKRVERGVGGRHPTSWRLPTVFVSFNFCVDNSSGQQCTVVDSGGHKKWQRTEANTNKRKSG